MVIPLGSGNCFSLRIYIFVNLNLEIFLSLRGESLVVSPKQKWYGVGIVVLLQHHSKFIPVCQSLSVSFKGPFNLV